MKNKNKNKTNCILEYKVYKVYIFKMYILYFILYKN